ncbi:MAG: hypothetical protein QM642_11040 [Edaphocola sp.]
MKKLIALLLGRLPKNRAAETELRIVLPNFEKHCIAHEASESKYCLTVTVPHALRGNAKLSVHLKYGQCPAAVDIARQRNQSSSLGQVDFLSTEAGVEKLYCGFVYKTIAGSANFAIDRNCLQGDLTYKKTETPVKIIVKTRDSKGRVVEDVFGDSHAAEVKTIDIPGEVSGDAKKQAAEREMIRYTYEGYRGSIESF